MTFLEVASMVVTWCIVAFLHGVMLHLVERFSSHRCHGPCFEGEDHPFELKLTKIYIYLTKMCSPY